MRLRVFGIELHRLLKALLGALPGLRTEFEQMVPPPQERFVGGEIRLVLVGPGRSRAKLDFERARDRLCDLILDGEDIGDLTVITLRPEVSAIGRGDQLRGDSDAVA